jgi:hypothetical protein
LTLLINVQRVIPFNEQYLGIANLEKYVLAFGFFLVPPCSVSALCREPRSVRGLRR